MRSRRLPAPATPRARTARGHEAAPSSSSDDPEGVCYPATMVTTADHDDRVVPAHSFKFAATIQAAQGFANPTIIRIETKAGHGAGKPTSNVIGEAADRWAFTLANMAARPVLP